MQAKAILLATAGLLGAGCASHESFTPAEKRTGVSPAGYSAAEYDLSTEDANFGEVRVWSTGAEEVRYDGEERTLLHVGFEVENASDDPLQMPAEGVRLESVALDDEVIENIAVDRLEGPDVIPAKQSARIDALFIMPPGIDPDDLDNFRVRWELRSNGTTYAEWTPFVELLYNEYAYGPGFDSYYMGAWGPPAYGTVYAYPYAYPYSYGYPYPYWY